MLANAIPHSGHTSRDGVFFDLCMEDFELELGRRNWKLALIRFMLAIVEHLVENCSCK